MKGVLLNALGSLTRSGFSTRGDELRTQSRAEVTASCAKGKGWEGLRKNVGYLGIKGDSKARMIFSAGR